MQGHCLFCSNNPTINCFQYIDHDSQLHPRKPGSALGWASWLSVGRSCLEENRGCIWSGRRRGFFSFSVSFLCSWSCAFHSLSFTQPEQLSMGLRKCLFAGLLIPEGPDIRDTSIGAQETVQGPRHLQHAVGSCLVPDTTYSP